MAERKKSLSLSGAYERGRNGTEVCEGGVWYELGGAIGAECEWEGAPAYVNGVSEAIFKIGMCLPAGPYVSDDDVRYIVNTIKDNIIG